MNKILIMARKKKTYTQKVRAMNPIAYWPLNETSGTVAKNYGTLGAAANGTYQGGVSLANAAGSDGILTPLFDGTNGVVNIITTALTALEGAFNHDEGTVMIWGKVSAAADWNTGNRGLLQLRADANNHVLLGTQATRSAYQWYWANNSPKGFQPLNIAGTGWICHALTWSKAANEVKVYLNGAQQSATATTLGDWAGNLAGAYLGTRASGQFWKGWLAHAAIWTTPLTSAQIRTLAKPSWDGFKGLLIMFDDSLANMFGGYQYMQAKGLMGTQYAISSLVDTAGYLTHENLATMDGAGWIIGNHADTATAFTSLTEAQQETALTNCQTALEGWGLTRGSKHVAYPGGAYNADTFTAMTNTTMLTGRNTLETGAVDAKTLYPYGISVCRGVRNTDTVAAIQAYINDNRNTRGKYCVIYFHGLVDAAPSTWQWLNSDFQILIDWIVAQGIPCKTIADFYADM